MHSLRYIYTIFTTHHMTRERKRNCAPLFPQLKNVYFCLDQQQQQQENKIRIRMVNVCYQQNKWLSGVFCLSHSEFVDLSFGFVFLLLLLIQRERAMRKAKLIQCQKFNHCSTFFLSFFSSSFCWLINSLTLHKLIQKLFSIVCGWKKNFFTVKSFLFCFFSSTFDMLLAQKC